MRTSLPLRRRALTTATATAALLAGSALAPVTASAAETSDSTEAADFATTWIVRSLLRDGGAVGFSGGVDPGTTVDALLGVAAAGHADQLDDLLVAMALHPDFDPEAFETYLRPETPPAGGIAGRLGKSALVDVAAGLETDRSSDADERILATERPAGDPEAGLFLEEDADFNSFGQTFQQSFALLGLAALEVGAPQGPVDWLLGQQCADGGFTTRTATQATLDLDNSCSDQVAGADTPDDPSDDVFETPPTIDATALAVQALVAARGDAPDADAADAAVAAALDWLASRQDANGGFGGDPANQTDPDATGATNTSTTALVVQAIVAGGEDPTAGRWVTEDGNDPVATLTALQLGCEVDASDRGALPFPYFGIPADAANAFATFQGVWGLGARPFPFARAVGDGLNTAVDLPFADCELTTTTAAGDDRAATAAAVALTAFPDGAGTVLLATGRDFADAVVAGPLAAALSAPLLLVDGDTPDADLVAALETLGTTEAVVLGGPAAVSTAYVDALVAATALEAESVERLAGDDRYATAVTVAARIDAVVADGADEDAPPADERPVFVAQGTSPVAGQGFADALALSTLAGQSRTPILLTAPSRLPVATAEAVAGREVQVVGGEAAVDADVLALLDVANGDPEAVRVFAGTDRYDTMYRISLATFRTDADFGTVWIATGQDFPDALAAGAAAAARGEVLVTVPGTAATLPELLLHAVASYGSEIDRLVVAGGPAVVDPARVAELATAARVQAR